MKSAIKLFADQGVSANALRAMNRCLKRHINLDYHTIQRVTANELIHTPHWEEETALLVMPGGRARGYYDALKAVWKKPYTNPKESRQLATIGEGNKRIKAFVEQGGGYLGICAGAYYASQITDFAVADKERIYDEGALNFFEGKAKGPVFQADQFDNTNEAGSTIAIIDLPQWQLHDIPIYFNGGCQFIRNDPSVEINDLAFYQDVSSSPASAIIELAVGAGKVILSGVHFEYVGIESNVYPQYRERLQSQQAKINQLVHQILGQFDLHLLADMHHL